MFKDLQHQNSLTFMQPSLTHFTKLKFKRWIREIKCLNWNRTVICYADILNICLCDKKQNEMFSSAEQF